jgi:hypothetical protein
MSESPRLHGPADGKAAGRRGGLCSLPKNDYAAFVLELPPMPLPVTVSKRATVETFAKQTQTDRVMTCRAKWIIYVGVKEP